MNHAITEKIDRIKRYTKRICNDLHRGDPVQAMADTAELAEIARRLYHDFAAVAKTDKKN